MQARSPDSLISCPKPAKMNCPTRHYGSWMTPCLLARCGWTRHSEERVGITHRSEFVPRRKQRSRNVFSARIQTEKQPSKDSYSQGPRRALGFAYAATCFSAL